MADNDQNKGQKESEEIKLSSYTTALISALRQIKPKPRPDDLSVLTVSQTVSLFALAYEKIRNAVEFREDHLILRAAIERIIRRRFSLNPSGKGEAENLLRELLWARYFDTGTLGGDDVNQVQKVIDNYIRLRNLIVIGRPAVEREYFSQFLLDLLTVEIEETLKPDSTALMANLTFFIYQVLHQKIKIEGVNNQQKDIYFLIAVEKAFRKSDQAHQRYHLFISFYKRLKEYQPEDLEDLAIKLPAILRRIDQLIGNPYVENLTKFTRKQMPPFIILFDIFKKKFSEIEAILTNKNKLWNQVDFICREKYQQLGRRISTLAVRSFIYILLTKMLFALILEYPLSMFIYGNVNHMSILINSLFPPFLMALIVTFFRIPGEENTRKIYERIIEIIDADKSFETKVAFMPKKQRQKNSGLIFGFTVFYSLTFIITFLLIYEILSLLNFNLISQLIFIFFVSVVTFFSYRVKQISKELKLEEKESIFTPFIDFFFMPILSLGKFFSQEIARLNFFIIIFDFLIEAPFKMIFEVIEEWISFVRKRKDEIA
jgi:hypothetical protein